LAAFCKRVAPQTRITCTFASKDGFKGLLERVRSDDIDFLLDAWACGVLKLLVPQPNARFQMMFL
jgi:hypothetical protein